MKCLFCKKNSDNSKSVEHIIPESLGNVDHILARGIVCDSCNNYFALKVEGPLLEQSYFKSIRHRNDIKSKKGKSIPEKGIILHPHGGFIDVYREEKGIIVNVPNARIADLIKTGKVNSLIIPFGELEPQADNMLLSRFLAKISVESLLYRIIKDPEWIEEVMTKAELDDIKKYARYGTGRKIWRYHQRRIYREEDRFLNQEIMAEPYEVLHEFQFFWTKEMEFYFVIAIMGIEYAINMGGPSIDTFRKWLAENNNRSILEDAKEKLIKSK